MTLGLVAPVDKLTFPVLPVLDVVPFALIPELETEVILVGAALELVALRRLAPVLWLVPLLATPVLDVEALTGTVPVLPVTLPLAPPVLVPLPATVPVLPFTETAPVLVVRLPIAPVLEGIVTFPTAAPELDGLVTLEAAAELLIVALEIKPVLPVPFTLAADEDREETFPLPPVAMVELAAIAELVPFPATIPPEDVTLLRGPETPEEPAEDALAADDVRVAAELPFPLVPFDAIVLLDELET